MARKILLADDSVTAQNMGRKILADAGYEVITVNNGSAALKKIGETRPDLIVLDVYMPGYSGLEVCQRLKDVGDTARIPILLTVGKLEPFKPEEAKRVRADAFIVKPFEASELLSALTKLEDKVVPRADSAKPGRLARATAAIEEGRYDKTMAVESDSGWKNRIAFPRKKKEKPQEKEIDTGEIYNQVNKDLRTIVDHKQDTTPSAYAETSHDDQTHVHLGALTPQGLPKDITPEEIAALAAAAAQIQGKVLDQPAPMAEAPFSAPTPVEATISESVEAVKPEVSEPVTVEHKDKDKEEAQLAEPAAVTEVAASASEATFAAHEPPAPEKTEEKKPEHKSGPAEVMAAIAGLETEWISLPAAGFGNAPWAAREKDSAEPVTMAVASPADSSAAPPRWSAVAVALAPEEAAISLEQEMQKAYAAFAAAEGGHSAIATQASENNPTEPEQDAAQSSVAESHIANPVATQADAAIPATPAPEVAQSLAAVSEAATDVVSAAMQELEVVAAQYEPEQSPAPAEPFANESMAAAVLESQAVSEPQAASEPQVEENGQKVQDRIDDQIEAKIEEPMTVSEPSPQVEEGQNKQEIPPAIEDEESPMNAEASEEKPTSEVATDPAPIPAASTARTMDDMATRESETAAAWASWRKIRETGHAKPPQAEASEEALHDTAAMAVAAGAESKPEEVGSSPDSDPEIASIVDSVLSDMRPRIVQEIARKLGKKK